MVKDADAETEDPPQEAAQACPSPDLDQGAVLNSPTRQRPAYRQLRRTRTSRGQALTAAHSWRLILLLDHGRRGGGSAAPEALVEARPFRTPDGHPCGVAGL
jgi:hypothetical protein